VTRMREQASVLSERLRTLGAEAIELPAIRILPPVDWGPLDRAIASLATFDWMVFTSANGVRHFWGRLAVAGLDARALHGVRLAAIGPATAAALQRNGLSADYMPGEYMAEAVAAGLGPVENRRILLPRADIARPALAELLRQGGANVVEVTAYRTGTPEIGPDLGAGSLDRLLRGVTAATFTSSSTVRNLAGLARDRGVDLPAVLQGAIVACIGPITAQTAQEVGLPVHLVAAEYTIDGLVEALVHHFKDASVAASPTP
jgi:uroporphyrinogen III methyltransferase/synthase